MTNDQYDSVGCFNDRSCAVRVTCANTLGSPDPPTPVLLATIARPVRERLPSQGFGGFLVSTRFNSFQLVSTRFNSFQLVHLSIQNASVFFLLSYSRTLALSYFRTLVLSYICMFVTSPVFQWEPFLHCWHSIVGTEQAPKPT